MRRLILSSLLVLSFALVSNLVRAEAKLKVGDKAPALSVAKWVKGKPLSKFEKGKIYVVEFWATWCGPCKQTIPHLTELAKKYKNKVTFTGVSIWETEGDDKSTEYMTTVAKFVKDMGDKMDYNVAVDGVSRTVAKNWMEAAEQGGIPTAFIVDKNTQIAWIGHPMAGMGEILDQVVADKFDSKAHAAKQAKAREMQAKAQKLFKGVNELAQKGQFKEAVAELDKILAENPEFESQVALPRFNLLLKSDEAAACAFARKLAEGQFKDNAQVLNQLAWTLVDDNSKLTSPDYEAALAIAERACELTKHEDAMILDTLAYAHFKKGNVDKAIEIQEKAVKLLEKQQVPEEIKKEMSERLEMFKKKKA